MSALELIESGWLLALAPAALLVRGRAIERRRQRELNRGLHELRRPLQTLALSSGRNGAGAPKGFLELAMSALGDLDRTVNGTAGTGQRQEIVSCRDLVVATVGRWRASTPDLDLQLYWDADSALLQAFPERLSQALDNLIANALEHGRPPLTLTGCVVSSRLRITLSDRGPVVAPNGANGSGPDRDRRGHGLALVSEVAAVHGGRFALSRSRRGTVAALELPLADPVALRTA